MGSARERKGTDFPFRNGENGFPQPATGVDAVLADFKSELLTSTGEVPMQPNQGSAALSYVFENVTPLVKSLVSQEVRRIAAKFPELILLGVLVNERSEGLATKMVVTIQYEFSGDIGEEDVVL